MKTIVITGSTRGIGFGLAEQFLQRGCRVVVSGRSEQAVNQAVAQLTNKYGGDRVAGQPCDVSVYEQAQKLWDAAAQRFGRVDVWINNAGISNPYVKFWEVKPEMLKAVTDTNLLGSLYGSHVALRGMLAQGGGQLYNMEGFGSDGRVSEGLAVYGSTKAAIRYLNKALLCDAKGTNVQIGTLSPGIVVTDLWNELYEGQPERREKAKRIVNILGDKVETVTPWLVERVLANNKSGARIAWLTTGKAFSRFLTASFRKRDLFAS
jgi:NAD(P)-dependent dehydrogenase (short-subunit alcohol dehydrogenase family)